MHLLGQIIIIQVSRVGNSFEKYGIFAFNYHMFSEKNINKLGRRKGLEPAMFESLFEIVLFLIIKLQVKLFTGSLVEMMNIILLVLLF